MILILNLIQCVKYCFLIRKEILSLTKTISLIVGERLSFSKKPIFPHSGVTIRFHTECNDLYIKRAGIDAVKMFQ